MNIKQQIILCVVLINFLCLFIQKKVYTQDDKTLSNWSLSLNGGATLLWGDLSDEVSIPFQKYFTPEQAYGFGIIGTRKINSIFDVNAQLIVSNLKGRRSKWTSDAPIDFSLHGSFQELNLNASVDLFNLMLPYKELRPFTLYLKGGVGYTFYNSTKTDNLYGRIYQPMKGNALIIPWGGGAKIIINEHYNLYFETSFHHAFSDEIDAHVGTGSDVNDIYTYTSIGATYRFNERVRKPRLKIIDEEPIDTIIASANTQEQEIENQDIEIVTAFSPSIIFTNDTFNVSIRINKQKLYEKARIQQTLPLGMTAYIVNAAGADFSFTDQIVSFSWQNLKEDEAFVNIEYKAITKNITPKNYLIAGILFYDKNGAEQILQFKESIEVKESPIVAVVNEPVINKIDSSKTNIPVEIKEKDLSTIKNETITNISNKGLEYRVQIKANFNQQSDIKTIANELKINEIISEENFGQYYKYCAGNFKTYQEAKAYKDILRNSSVPGAFIVAFIDGKRVNNIQEALLFEKSTTNQSNTSVVTNQTQSQAGTEYKIQISASTKPQLITQLQKKIGSNEIISETKHNKLYKYVIGNYKEKSVADTKLAEIRIKIPDAFIVKYINGKRP